MGELVNLNQYRKKRDREEARRNAAANRAKFGRDKAERREGAFDRERREANLNASRLDPRADPPAEDAAPAAPGGDEAAAPDDPPKA